MADWYYQVLGKNVGPLSSKELLEKVRTGQIEADTPIRKDDSQWVPASEVNGLFAAAYQDEKYLVCPYCGNSVAKPPTTCKSCDRLLERAILKSRKSPPAKASVGSVVKWNEDSPSVAPIEDNGKDATSGRQIATPDSSTWQRLLGALRFWSR